MVGMGWNMSPETPAQRQAKVNEKTEILDGTRRKQVKERAAVRIEDMTAILKLKQRMQSAKAAGATVTVAEFDALFRDVETIFKAMVEVSVALGLKVEP